MGLFRATVDLEFPIGSGRGTNTWHLRTLTSGGTTTEVENLMDLIRTFYTSVNAYLPSTYRWRWDGLVQEVGVPDPALLEQGDPWEVPGAGPGSTFAPAPTMACVTWRSSLATRRGRGRTFLGPMAQAAFEANGTLTSAALSAIRNASAALVSASLTDTNGAVVVWSELDSVGRDIIAASVTDQAAVLRSRR